MDPSLPQNANRRANIGCIFPLVIVLFLAFIFILGAVYEYRQVRQAKAKYEQSAISGSRIA